MFTAKQVRNGTNIGADGHNTAVDDMGPLPAIPMDAAMAQGNAYNDTGLDVMMGSGIPSVLADWDDDVSGAGV